MPIRILPIAPQTAPRTALSLALLAVLSASGGACFAQADDTPPPAREDAQTEAERTAPPDRRPDARLDPLLTDISADENIRDRLTRPLGGIPVSPSRSPMVQQAVPNLGVDAARLALADGTAARIDPDTLRAEGTFLVAWTGEIVRLRTGGLAFLPVAQEGADRPEPAMGLVPCTTYSRIEGLLGDDTRGLWLSLTGEVLMYQDRNWLLPTLFAGADTPPPGKPAPTEPSESNAASATGVDEQPTENPTPDQAQPDQPEGQPAQPIDPGSGDRVEDLIRQLERQREERRGIDTTFAPPKDGSPAGEAAPPGPRLDGKMLLSQRGRMVRSPQGGWVVAIDNDGGATGITTLPNHLRLLPCKIVEAMEYQAEKDGESWTFEVSGHLYRHGNTVYLLPRMYVSLAKDEVKALQ